jgi:hypothetical protein
LGTSVQTIMQMGGRADTLCPFILSRVFSLKQFHSGLDCERISNFVQISRKAQWRLCKWLDKRLGKKTWAIHRKTKLTDTKKGEIGEEQSQKHAPFNIKGTVHKEFSLEGQTVNFTYCSDVLRLLRENVCRVHPKL